jgi:Raf kinase inhibitor-like YbhB/YbcL family protein
VLCCFFLILIPFTFLAKGESAMSFQMTTSAFSEGENIPSKYTCDGSNISPHLTWTNPPAGTQVYALIMDDPDAPMGTWTHWVVYNMPATLLEIKEAIPEKNFPESVKHGKNSWAKVGYGGPCPPSGTHRYFFKLYALKQKLNTPWGATAAELEKAMQGLVLGETKLMGRYARIR